MKRKGFSAIFVTFLFYFFSFFAFAVPLWAKVKSVEIGVLLEKLNYEVITSGVTMVESGLRKGINVGANKEPVFGDFVVYIGTVEYNIGSLHEIEFFSGEVSYFGIRGEAGVGLNKIIGLSENIGNSPIKPIPYLALAFDFWSKSRAFIYEDVGDFKESMKM